jgi:hypothetical protein
MSDKIAKKVIGRVEPLQFPEIGVREVHARIDTGAKTSAIWASRIWFEEGALAVVFFSETRPEYSGKVYHFNTYEQTVVASSNGQAETRYKVKLLVNIKGRSIRAHFTLADRSTQVYPVLIGRNVLRGKFVVDVKQGKPLKSAERNRTEQLRANLEKAGE